MNLVGEPPADVGVSVVLATLLQNGRWGDAASYYPNLDDTDPIEQAQLLLAAGRSDEAHTLLSGRVIGTDEDDVWPDFVTRVDAVIHGENLNLPDLVTMSTVLPGHPLVHMLMLRAAEAAARPEVAAHFANLLRDQLPGDIDAARALAVDLVRRTDYVEAIKVIDRAELSRCIDETDPLNATLDQLAANGEPVKVSALVTIGHYVHRETDPTRAVDDASRDARQRWRAAYRARAPRRWRRNSARVIVLVAGLAASIAVGNALPSVLLVLAFAAWARTRPLPGLDIRTSQLVRAIKDPLQILNRRRYRVIDVFTFIFTLVVAGGLAAQLPHRPSWLNWVEAIAVGVAAVAATRGRRRWIRHEQHRLMAPVLDPHTCSCLEAASLHGMHARRYVDTHLFRIGPAPGAPQWPVLQCLNTHTRYLDLPTAQLTLRLPPQPPRQLIRP